MAEIGALHAALSADTAQFETNMGRARRAVRNSASGMKSSMEGVRRKFGEALTALNRYGGLAATVAAGSIAVFIKKQIDAADALGKMAQQTGTSTEFLSSMGLVAEQTGTKLETIAKGVQRLSMNMNDFRRGVGESKEAFQDLGLVVENENGTLRNSEEVLLDIAEKFAGMQDGADKTALAMRLFGRAGAELIPMLNQGRDGIVELQNKAQEMGLVISTETAMQAAFLNDQLNILKNEALGAGRSIALNLLPDLNEAIQVIKYAKEESGLLTAAWVALGAVGSALFVKSLTQQINETRAALKVLTDAQDQGARVARGAGEVVLGKNAIAYRISELRDELAKLEAQREREDANEKARMEGALQRSEAEANRRAAATEAMREAATERLKLEQVERTAAQAEESRVKAIEATIEALKTQRDTMSMNAGEIAVYRLGLLNAEQGQKDLAQSIYEEIVARETRNSAMERGKQIFQATRTDEELFRAQVDELNKLLRQGAIDAETYWRAISQSFEPISGKAEQAVIDSQAERILESLRTEEQVLQDSYDKRREIILQSTILAEEEKNAVILDLARQRDEQLAQLDAMRTSVMLQNYGSMFGAMADITGEFAGKQSALYRTMFAASKAFALADAIVKIQQGIANAASLPFPANLAAMASVAASTAGIVSTIASTQPSFEGGGFTGYGARFGGVDGRGGFPAILHPNESVIDHNQGVGSGVNLRIVNVLDPKIVESWANSASGERVIMNIVSRNKQVLT